VKLKETSEKGSLPEWQEFFRSEAKPPFAAPFCPLSAVDQTKSFGATPVNVRSSRKLSIGMIEADDRLRALVAVVRSPMHPN